MACEQVSEESSSQAESSCCASNSNTENDEQRKVALTEPYQIKNISSEHYALRESIIKMETLIEALKKENDQLREGTERKKIFLKKSKQEEIQIQNEQRIKELQKENYSLLESNEYLKNECDTLYNEMADLKARIIDLRITQQDNLESSPSKPGRRHERLSLLLKKIAEYSREIISDRYNPIQFELYGTIFNKFLKQIDLLQRQRDQVPVGSPRQPVGRS